MKITFPTQGASYIQSPPLLRNSRTLTLALSILTPIGYLFASRNRNLPSLALRITIGVTLSALFLHYRLRNYKIFRIDEYDAIKEFQQIWNRSTTVEFTEGNYQDKLLSITSDGDAIKGECIGTFVIFVWKDSKLRLIAYDDKDHSIYTNSEGCSTSGRLGEKADALSQAFVKSFSTEDGQG